MLPLWQMSDPRSLDLCELQDVKDRVDPSTAVVYSSAFQPLAMSSQVKAGASSTRAPMESNKGS